MDVLSFCDGFNNHHIGTLRCRQEGASTPSTESRDDGKPPQTGMLSMQRRPKPNPDSSAERKPFRGADFFSALIMQHKKNQSFSFSSIRAAVFQTSADIRIIAKSTNLSK
jgi:hypothetical protein